MSYIGSTPTTQNFIAGTDQFTGDGSQTDWTLSRFVNSTNDIEVVIANVVQNPTSYSVSGNTLTISPAVGNGTVFYVRYLSTTLQTFAPSDGTVSTQKLQTASVTPAKLSTGAPSWTSGGNLSFNSGYGSNAVAYGCRAWVNFNGTGTVAIRASGNVSSITDNGVGDYTVNFTTAMPDTNYSFLGFARRDNDTWTSTQAISANSSFTKTTSAFRVKNNYIDNGGAVNLNDVAEINIVAFR